MAPDGERSASTETTVLVGNADGIRWITLNRPEVLNALRLVDVRAIEHAVRTAEGSAAAVVITGAGVRSFCAGMHLDEFVSTEPHEGRRLISEIGACVGTIRRCRIPTVAMINGYCLGVGFEMALACDLRVAVPEARFGLPEVKLGIPSVIEAALLPHYVGLSTANEMLLTGDLYGVDDLATHRLVNRVASHDALRPTVERLVADLSVHTRLVLATQKQLIQTWLDVGLQAGIDASIDVFGEVFAAPVTTDAIARYRSGLAARS